MLGAMEGDVAQTGDGPRRGSTAECVAAGWAMSDNVLAIGASTAIAGWVAALSLPDRAIAISACVT